MKMISAIALLSLTAVAAPAQDLAQTTRSFAMRGFDRIDMAGCDIASVRLGSGFAVQVQGRADNIANLRIDTIGSTLRIRRRDDSCNGHDRRVAINITLPSLKAVDVSGAAELTLPSIAIARFDVGASGAAVLRMAALRGASARFDVSGASKVVVQDLQAEHVDLDLSGASDLRAEGEVRRLGVGGSGTSHADLRGLRTSDAKMSASGMARIRAVVLHQVEADASGMANIAVEGPAQCSTSKSGMARITCGR